MKKLKHNRDMSEIRIQNMEEMAEGSSMNFYQLRLEDKDLTRTNRLSKDKWIKKKLFSCKSSYC